MFTNKLMPLGGAPFYSYEIDQSCRFNDDDSAYMYWTPSGAPDDPKKWTFRALVKRCNMGSVQILVGAGTSSTNRTIIAFQANDTLLFYSYYSAAVRASVSTGMVFRDPTAWYDIVVSLDAANNQVTFSVNGDEVSQTVATAVNNSDHLMNAATTNAISRDAYAASSYGDYYLAEVQMIDGLELAATSFGEFKNNIWIPKSYTGAYGTNGYYLDFSNSSHFGEDQSVNSNDLTDSGLATNDQVLDTPTNNYCVINGVDNYAVLKDGNLYIDPSAGAGYDRGVFGVSSGKWYWEATVKNDVGGYPYIGIVKDFPPLRTINFFDDPNGWAYGGFDGNKHNDQANGAGDSYGATYTTNDVVGVALDMDAGTLTFYKNNVSQGTAYSSLTGTFFPALGDGSSTTDFEVNFGQLGFTYTPPTGFKALCSANMTDPTIKDSTTGFYAQTRTGTGAEATISDVNFNVSGGALVWVKNRDQADSHNFVDTSRGATLELNTDTAAVESTVAQGIKSFSSSGYVIGTDVAYNTNTEDYIDYVLRKGPSNGFDIVTYSGTGVARTITHDLNAVPKLIIVKNRDVARSWAVYHSLVASDPETDFGILDTSAAFADNATYWNDTAPTTTVFSVGTSNAVNENGQNFVAYLFTDIPQYQKIFTYTGNGNADGPFIPLDFRPAFYFVKRSNTTGNWWSYDTARWTYNPTGGYILIDSAGAEVSSSAVDMDLLANGIKVRDSDAGINGSGSTYVGIAIAEQPGKYSNAR